MDDLAPLEMFQRTLRRWWWLALSVICGGLLGWAFAQARPPLYQAYATYQVSIEEAALRERLALPLGTQLTFAMVEPFNQPVMAVFFAEDVQQSLAQAAQQEGLPLAAYTHLFERRSNLWFVGMQGPDPGAAARLANLWVQSADQALQAAQAQALTLQSLTARYNALEKCFAANDFAAANQCAGTAYADRAAYDAAVQALQSDLETANQLSRNIDPIVIVGLLAAATPPADPVLYDSGGLVLAGLVMGLLVALILIHIAPVRNK